MAYRGEVLLGKEGRVAILSINRPERLNALTVEAWQELAAALAEVAKDGEVGALLLTGRGRGFCSGVDMTDISHRARERVPLVALIPARLVACPKPTIAAINGVAVGDGLALALACDIRIASELATFSVGFLSRGLAPILGCTYLLPRAVGLARALELMYTGSVIDAGEALRLGLVRQVVPHEELMPAALALAQRLAQGPPLALTLTKELARRSLAPEVAWHMEKEGLYQLLCLETKDFQEGLRSFGEKREPTFGGA